jgi:ribosomal protein L18
VKKSIKGGGNIAAAKVVGKAIAERAQAKGVDKVVFTTAAAISITAA